MLIQEVQTKSNGNKIKTRTLETFSATPSRYRYSSAFAVVSLFLQVIFVASLPSQICTLVMSVDGKFPLFKSSSAAALLPPCLWG